MQARRTEMTKTVRARYTLEFKQEAVRLVTGGQSSAAAARSLGVVEQTLFNWVKAERQGCWRRPNFEPDP
jgi:transposase